MGFRYRKSVKLPFGIRLNFSKSGVGFSYGVKGYRKSISPSGQVRTTYSIPGTGLSYTKNEGNIHDKKGETLLYGLAIAGNLYYVRTNSRDEAIWEHTGNPHCWKTLAGAEKARDRISLLPGIHRDNVIQVVGFRYTES